MTPLRKVILALIAVFTLATASICYAVDTEIRGTLLQEGNPVENAIILGCLDPDKNLATCVSSFETKTDSQGKFLFLQKTGIFRSEYCIGCPCHTNKPASCDPGWRIRFSVLVDGKSSMLDMRGMGFGFTEPQSVVCEIRKDWVATDLFPEVVSRDVSTPSDDLPNTRKIFMRCT